MRRIAFVDVPGQRVRKIILHSTSNGTYLYHCDRTTDSGGFADYWYAEMDDAIGAAQREFGVSPDAWSPLEDTLPGCLDDFEAPVRKKRGSAPPEFERLTGGEWVPFKPR